MTKLNEGRLNKILNRHTFFELEGYTTTWAKYLENVPVIEKRIDVKTHSDKRINFECTEYKIPKKVYTLVFKNGS